MILVWLIPIMQFLSFLPSSSIYHNLTLQQMLNRLLLQKLLLSILLLLLHNALLHRPLSSVLVLLTNVVVTLQCELMNQALLVTILITKKLVFPTRTGPITTCTMILHVLITRWTRTAICAKWRQYSLFELLLIIKLAYLSCIRKPCVHLMLGNGTKLRSQSLSRLWRMRLEFLFLILACCL